MLLVATTLAIEIVAIWDGTFSSITINSCITRHLRELNDIKERHETEHTKILNLDQS